MPKFHAVLQSQTSEQRRYVTLSTVPCSSCHNDPHGKLDCVACGGLGEEPATKKTAKAFLDAQEREYVEFRLDDPRTHRRYPSSLGASFASPDEALARVSEHCVYIPKDTHLVNGKFARAGKVLGQNSLWRGWYALHLQGKPYVVAEIGEVGPDGPRAAVTAGQYGTPLKNMVGGTRVWDWDTDTIKCSLHTSTYVPNNDTDDTFTNATNEITGTGYTAGGATLAASAPTYDTATDQIRCDAVDTTWTTSTLTARIAVIYKSTGTASTSPLLAFVNFGADVSTTAGTFQITWDATGIFIIDVT
jgi:hypothetical protein